MKIFAMVFFVLGLPLFVGWWQDQFVIFWTVPGAALVQVWGSAAACLAIDWMYRPRPWPTRDDSRGPRA